MRILDRYILKNFAVPFLYCFLGFIAMWLAFDLADKTNDLVTSRISPSTMLYYYGTQIPQYVVIVLPVALLLSLLYSLSRMSRSNEIISMLASGLSLYRLIVPLIFAGIVVSGLCLAMNYELGPHAEPSKRAIMESLSQGKGKRYFSLLFRNRADCRTWLLQLHTNQLSPYSRAADIDLKTVESIHITQQDKEGNIIRKYYAHGMTFDPATKTWTFSNGKTVNFNLDGDPVSNEDWETLKIKDWSETPWRIYSTDLEAENLSVPELRDYLHFNADFAASQLAAYKTYFYYQWAVPAACLVVVFIAVPLGIVYSRRGVLVGVAGALLIFFGDIFFDKLFLALGKHGSIPPLFAGWGTNMIFGAVGLVMLYLRAGTHVLLQVHPKILLHIFKHA